MSQMHLIYVCQKELVICCAASLYPRMSYALLETTISLKGTKNKFFMRALYAVQVRASREGILTPIWLAVQSETAVLELSIVLKHRLSIWNMYNSLLSPILALRSLTLNGTITLSGERKTTALCNLYNSPHPPHWDFFTVFPSSSL